MGQTGIIAAIGFSVLALFVTLDSALGLGGAAFIADICRTILDDGMAADAAAGGDMAMQPKPLPLILLSLAATIGMVAIATRDHWRELAGSAPPDVSDTAAILSAIATVAATSGRSRREELADIYRIVAGVSLEEEIADYLLDRVRDLQGATVPPLRFTRLESAIGRRRVLAAAFIAGGLDRDPTTVSLETVERLVEEIGATGADIAAARNAVRDWVADSHAVPGVSIITLLRHRPLALRPT